MISMVLHVANHLDKLKYIHMNIYTYQYEQFMKYNALIRIMLPCIPNQSQV